MEPALEELYLYWIGNPDPTKWPKHLQNSPLIGHGEYAFREGLLLGLRLAAAAFLPEPEL